MNPYLYGVLALLCFAILMLFNVRETIVNKVEEKKLTKSVPTKKKVFDEPPSKWKAFINKKNRMLKFTGMPIAVFIVLTIVSLGGGFILGKLMFQDTFLAIVMASGFIIVPSLYLEIESAKIKLNELRQIENTMSILTNAYMSNHDIVTTVKDNIHLIEYKKPFEEFLVETTYFDSSVDNALQHIANRNPNRYFVQWVEILILSQTDRSMLSVLPTIVQKMNEHRRAQIEANTSMTTTWSDYFMLLGIICSFPLVFRFVMYDWYVILVTTIAGKGLMVALIATILYSLTRAISINKPLSM